MNYKISTGLSNVLIASALLLSACTTDSESEQALSFNAANSHRSSGVIAQNDAGDDGYTSGAIANDQVISGNKAELLIASVLAQLGEVDTFKPGCEQGVDQIIESTAAHVARVVVVGGDGTLNMALPSVVKRGLPPGIKPCGTANDFARSVGVPDENAAIVATTVAEENMSFAAMPAVK